MDLFLSISTLLLSVIAIAVSIYTIHRQNKLNLFEKRYEAFYTMGFLVAVAQTVIKNQGQMEKDILTASKNAYFDINALTTQKCDSSDLKSFYHYLCLSAAKAELLFPKKLVTPFLSFLNSYISYYSTAIDGNDTEDLRKKLQTSVERLDNQDTLNKLEKHMRVG